VDDTDRTKRDKEKNKHRESNIHKAIILKERDSEIKRKID